MPLSCTSVRQSRFPHSHLTFRDSRNWISQKRKWKSREVGRTLKRLLAHFDTNDVIPSILSRILPRHLVLCPSRLNFFFSFSFFFLVPPSCALHLDRSPSLSLSPHTDDMLHVGKIHTQVSRVEKGRDHRSNIYIYIYIYFSFLYIRARVMYLQETKEATSIRLRDYMYTYVYYIVVL